MYVGYVSPLVSYVPRSEASSPLPAVAADVPSGSGRSGQTAVQPLASVHGTFFFAGAREDVDRPALPVDNDVPDAGDVGDAEARRRILRADGRGGRRRLRASAAAGEGDSARIRSLEVPRVCACLVFLREKGETVQSDAMTQMTWPVVTGWPGSTESCGDETRAVRVHLVLHLHRLDDADHLPRLDLLAVGDAHGEDGALHRGDDRVLARAAGAAPRGRARDAAPPAPATRARAP